MISRRSFLAALSCLPFVGKMIPQAKITPITLAEPSSVELEFAPIHMDGKIVGWQRVSSPGAWTKPLKPLDDDATIRRLGDYMRKVQEDAIKESFVDRKYQA